MNRLRSYLLGSTILRDAAEVSGAGDGGEGGGGVATAVTPPAGLENWWDAEKGALKLEELAPVVSELQAFKAENEQFVTETRERLKGVPENPDAYEVKLPESFEKPEGFEFDIAADDPLLKTAREFAKSAGLTQPQFEELIGIRAAIELQEIRQLEAASKAEMEKLGSKATERVTAVEKFLSVNYGERGEKLAAGLFTKDQLEVVEDLIAKAKGGGGGFNGSGRSDDDGKQQISDEDWEKMTESDRINYARSRAAGRS